MEEPTVKDNSIDNLLNHMSGTNRIEQIKSNNCTWCKGDASSFRDELSKKEYTISGFCQKCQDEVFGE